MITHKRIAFIILFLVSISFLLSKSKSPQTVNAPTYSSVRQIPKKSSQAKKDNWQLIQEAAIDTTRITITNCLADPYVTSLNQDEMITFINTDNQPHSLEINDQNTIHLPSLSDEQAVGNFNTGPGIYAYSCDNKDDKNNGGMIVIN